MSLTNHGAKGMLDGIFSTFGATLYVALFTTLPGEDETGGTEVSGGSYAREAVTDADFAAATDADPSVLSNSSVIDFGTTTAAWGTVVGFGIFDASSGGNLIWAGNLTASQAVGDGDDVSFAAGALDLTLD